MFVPAAHAQAGIRQGLTFRARPRPQAAGQNNGLARQWLGALAVIHRLPAEA